MFVFCTAETSKWKKISYAFVPFVCAVTVYVMGTHHHEHHEEVRPPPTPPPPLCAHLLSLPTHPEASHVAEQPKRPSSIWPAMPVISPPLQVAYPFMKKRNKEYPWALQGGTQCTHYNAPLNRDRPLILFSHPIHPCVEVLLLCSSPLDTSTISNPPGSKCDLFDFPCAEKEKAAKAALDA